MFLEIFLEAALGTPINAQNDSESELVKGIELQCRISIARAFSIVKSNAFLFKFTSDYQDHCKSIKVIHEYTNDIIRRRREQILEEKKSGTEENGVGNDKKRKCFLDLLLYKQLDGQAVSDKVIRDEVNTIIFGVSEKSV